MPWKTTVKRASKARREGKAPTTQAGEFVREEIEHLRRGKHGARSTKQAIAIGLSKARRAGVPLGVPEDASKATKKQAKRDLAKAKDGEGQRPASRGEPLSLRGTWAESNRLESHRTTEAQRITEFRRGRPGATVRLDPNSESCSARGRDSTRKPSL